MTVPLLSAFFYFFIRKFEVILSSIDCPERKNFSNKILYTLTIQTIQSSAALTFEPPSEGHISLEKHRHLDNYGMKINSDSDWKPSINFYFWLNRFQTKKWKVLKAFVSFVPFKRKIEFEKITQSRPFPFHISLTVR